MRSLGWGVFALLIGCHGEAVNSPSLASDATPDVVVVVTDTETGDIGSDVPSPTGCEGRVGTTKMVNLGGYCIDEHEVTNGQWKAFAADPDGSKSAPAHCNWNDTSAVVINPDSTTDVYPRGKVNFCDAKTYCAWAGKRLCGRIGGSMNAKYDFADPTKSQWYRACSGAAPFKYPYGDTYDAAKCATGTTGGIPVRPKSYSQCHGVAAPYDAVFDLVGSMDEWEDSCASEGASADTLCRGRGGGLGDLNAASCDLDRDTAAKARFDGLGFRCCKDL